MPPPLVFCLVDSILHLMALGLSWTCQSWKGRWDVSLVLRDGCSWVRWAVGVRCPPWAGTGPAPAWLRNRPLGTAHFLKVLLPRVETGDADVHGALSFNAESL